MLSSKWTNIAFKPILFFFTLCILWELKSWLGIASCMLDCLSYYISCIHADFNPIIRIMFVNGKRCRWSKGIHQREQQGHATESNLMPWFLSISLKARFVHGIFFSLESCAHVAQTWEQRFPSLINDGSALLSIFSRVDGQTDGRRAEGVQFKHRAMFARTETLSVCPGPTLLLKQLTPHRNNLRRDEKYHFQSQKYHFQ